MTIAEAVRSQSTNYMSSKKASVILAAQDKKLSSLTRAQLATQEISQEEAIPEILLQLVAERRKQKLTQAQVAKKMGTTASAVARLESGGGKKRHSPSLRTLKLYAASLGCDIKVELVR